MRQTKQELKNIEICWNEFGLRIKKSDSVGIRTLKWWDASNESFWHLVECSTTIPQDSLIRNPTTQTKKKKKSSNSNSNLNRHFCKLKNKLQNSFSNFSLEMRKSWRRLLSASTWYLSSARNSDYISSAFFHSGAWPDPVITYIYIRICTRIQELTWRPESSASDHSVTLPNRRAFLFKTLQGESNWPNYVITMFFSLKRKLEHILMTNTLFKYITHHMRL